MLEGDEGSDDLNGGGGPDTLSGGEDDDDLSGGGRADLLEGDDGNDTLDGGGGDDLLVGGPGADDLDGGSGTDTALYDGSPDPVMVKLDLGVGAGGDAEGDVLKRIEAVIGSDGGDTLIGDEEANLLDGGEGDNTLIGGDGDDTLDGGGGADEILAGHRDRVDGGRGADRIVIDVSEGGPLRVAINIADLDLRDTFAFSEGVEIQEVEVATRPVDGVEVSVAMTVGLATRGPTEAVAIFTDPFLDEMLELADRFALDLDGKLLIRNAIERARIDGLLDDLSTGPGAEDDPIF